MNLHDLLKVTIRHDASDLHLSGGNPPMLRINGEIRPLEAASISGDEIGGMVRELMTEQQRARYDTERELDFTLDIGEIGRFRANAFVNRSGAAIVLRVIPSRIPDLADLGAPPIIKQLANLERGLVLITGPTGSGKSTTLAAMIDHVNTSARRHILTIEDPVEFLHYPKQSLINQREVGHDTASFARALRSALREDPDVILVGEMRDHETMALALTAAETGHLVLGTLHANSAHKTIDRIIDVFPAADKPMARAMLAGSLQASVAQTLLRRRDGAGRVAAFEVLVATPGVRNLIREDKGHQLPSLMQTGLKHGMATMSDSIEALIAEHVVRRQDAEGRLMLAEHDDAELGQDAIGGPRTEDPEGSAPSPQPPRPLRGGGYSF